MTPTDQQHECCDGFQRPVFVFEDMRVCEFCRCQVPEPQEPQQALDGKVAQG